MSENKHTPGPWEWVGRDLESNFPGHYAAVIETTVSCGQFCYGGSVELTISDEDKRLIAAAPDLLALLVELVDIEGPCPGTASWASKVHAVIAQATGSQS
jgi:hypothetical protein